MANRFKAALDIYFLEKAAAIQARGQTALSVRDIPQDGRMSLPVSNVRNPGQNPIRSAIAAWFGPQQPILPVAPAGQRPRIFDYPWGVNIQIQPRQEDAISFQDLKNLADSYDILRLIIQTRIDQVRRHKLGFRLKAEPGEPKKKQMQRTQEDKRIATLTERFRKPDDEHTWSQWIGMFLDQHFVLDAASVLIQRKNNGQPFAFHVIDGATITRKITEAGTTPHFPEPAYQQIIKGMPMVDLTTSDLIYRPRNVRADHIYGYSNVEQAIVTINTGIRRELSQLEAYTDGSVPDGFAIFPENSSIEDVKAFDKYWQGLMRGNTAERRMLKFLPYLDKLEFPKLAALKDEFDNWIARVLCFNFSLPPTAFERMLSHQGQENSQESSMQEGLQPLLDFILETVLLIVEDEAGYHYEDIEPFFDQPENADPVKQAQIDKIYCGESPIMAPNEVRERLGLAPVIGGELPGVAGKTGFIPLGEQAQQQPGDGVGGGDGAVAAKLEKSAQKKRFYLQ